MDIYRELARVVLGCGYRDLELLEGIDKDILLDSIEAQSTPNNFEYLVKDCIYRAVENVSDEFIESFQIYPSDYVRHYVNFSDTSIWVDVENMAYDIKFSQATPLSTEDAVEHVERFMNRLYELLGIHISEGK